MFHKTIRNIMKNQRVCSRQFDQMKFASNFFHQSSRLPDRISTGRPDYLTESPPVVQTA